MTISAPAEASASFVQRPGARGEVGMGGEDGREVAMLRHADMGDAAGHDFGRLDVVRLGDVTRHAYVDRLACEMRELVMAVCGERDIALCATFRSKREDWIQGMVMAGMGFAFMPDHSVTTAGLLRRPLVEPAVDRAVLLTHMAGRALTPAGIAVLRAEQGHRRGE